MSDRVKGVPVFSIVVVSFNPGDKLLATVQSIEEQGFADYEVVVKDAGSKDGSLENLRRYLDATPELSARVRLYVEPDKGIYDGMNQAVKYTEGEYIYFLNCGDYFVDGSVLERLSTAISEDKNQGGDAKIYYGNIFDALREQVVQSNTKIDDFACYRNVPCHQACLYHRSLFEERGYSLEYRVRADYEHFLWSYFCKQAKPKYLPVTLASYEGGGFSETKENRRKSAEELGQISGIYMKKSQILLYRTIMLVTLAPLRTKMAESRCTAGVYNKIRALVYNIKKK